MFFKFKELKLPLGDAMLDIFVRLEDQAGGCLQCTFSLYWLVIVQGVLPSYESVTFYFF